MVDLDRKRVTVDVPGVTGVLPWNIEILKTLPHCCVGKTLPLCYQGIDWRRGFHPVQTVGAEHQSPRGPGVRVGGGRGPLGGTDRVLGPRSKPHQRCFDEHPHLLKPFLPRFLGLIESGFRLVPGIFSQKPSRGGLAGPFYMQTVWSSFHSLFREMFHLLVRRETMLLLF